MLKRYLRARYEMSPDTYRTKWGLPRDYPMVAPSYAATRSALAKSAGLGRKPAPEPAVSGTIMRIGRTGNSCASAEPVANSVTAAIVISAFMVPSHRFRAQIMRKEMILSRVPAWCLNSDIRSSVEFPACLTKRVTT